MMSFIQEIRKIDNKRMIWYNNDQCLGGLALKEEIKQERVKRKIKIANAIKCIMAVKRVNITDLSKATGYAPAYISRPLSGKKAMSENFVEQLSIVFDLPLDSIKSIIDYYLLLSDNLEDVIKDQLTMLYILEYVLDLKNTFLNEVFKDYNDKEIDKFKN